MRDNGRCFVLGVALLTALIWAPSAGAVVLSPTSAPLPGSNFQGGDGDQENADPLLDWQALAGSPNLVTSDDAATGDMNISGKENEPVNWDVSAGTGESNPPKSNLGTIWSLFDGSQFLYLAFSREPKGGNAYLGIELNQDTRLWTNANGDQIVCRTDGDLIVSYNVQNAHDVEIVVEQWVSDSVVSDVEAATGYANGEGCAKTGHFVEADPGTDNVQAAINYSGNAIAATNPDGSVTNHLPNSAGAASLSEGAFGEAAINLAGIYGAAIQDPCFSFGQISVHSRTSGSVNSSIADFIRPTAAIVRNCTISGHKYRDLNGNGTLEDGEPPIENHLIYLDLNDDNVLDAGEPTALTNAAGEYVFTNVGAGTYRIREAPDAAQSFFNQGYTCTAPTPCERSAVIDADNTNASGKDFLNHREGDRPAPFLRKIHYSMRFQYVDKHRMGWVVARLYCHSVVCDVEGSGKLIIKEYGTNHEKEKFRLVPARDVYEYRKGAESVGVLAFRIPEDGQEAVEAAIRHDARGAVRADIDMQGVNTQNPELNKKRFRDIKLFSGKIHRLYR